MERGKKMKVESSKFFEKKRQLYQRLLATLLEEYTYVSIAGEDSIGKLYQVQLTGSSIEDSRWAQRGFVVRVYNGVNYSEHSFNQLEESTFETIVERIRRTAIRVNELMEDAGIWRTKYEMIQEEPIHKSFKGEVASLPKTISYKEKINQLSQVMKKTKVLSDELLDVRVRYEEVQINKFFLSKKRDLEQSYIWSNTGVIPIGARAGKMKYAYEAISGLKGPDIINKLDNVYEKAVKSVLELLGSEPIKEGVYDIILNPSMSGLVAHEAFGHGVEMDMFVKERAKAVHYMDKQVAAFCIDMHDGAASAEEVSSYMFDDEGVLGTDTKIIDQGILRSGISDQLSALTLGTIPTGNGKRQNYEHKVYTRMTNTFFAGGQDSLEDMIASIDYGFLLEDYSSGMEDPKNWGIQCVVSIGREIKEGRLTGKIISPIYLTGYVPELLKSITMVSKEVELSGSGVCGKGHKELVKTSTGGAFIKAVGRLN